MVPIQFGWSFLSDREKRATAGIPKATYTAKAQAGKSVIKITTSQSAAVATNAIGNSLVDRPDLFWVMSFPRFVCRRRITVEPVKLTTSTRESAAHIRCGSRVRHSSEPAEIKCLTWPVEARVHLGSVSSGCDCIASTWERGNSEPARGD